MIKHFFDTEKIGLNRQLVKRGFILSIPPAALLIMLVFENDISVLAACLYYLLILAADFALLLPLSSELRILRNYIYGLAKGEAPHLPVSLSDKDTKELAEAINVIHRLWTSKADTLEAQTLSDAAVFDTLPDPILMLDGEGNVTGTNSPARQFLGTDNVNQNIDRLFSTNIFINAINSVLKGKSTSESVVFHAPEYKNRRIYSHINKLPEYLKGRAVAVVSLYDISKALSLEKMQSDFVANASHELKTPLSVISGFIETLQTSARDDADAREAFLAIMKEQAEYMSNLIEDLLSLSRLEMGQDKKLSDKVDIAEVIDDVSQALKIKAFQRSINVKIISSGRLPKIVGDNQQVHQVVQNLLSNAIKYSPENSEVTIELKVVPEIPSGPGQHVAPGKAVSISINNKGQKINKEELTRLTEKFYRMQIHKDMKIKGTGLGLSIAEQIVLHHHGNLTVTSTTYNGNTFTVYLPIKQQ